MTTVNVNRKRQQIVIGTPADGISRMLEIKAGARALSFETIAAMTASRKAALATGQQASVSDTAQGGSFVWNADSTATADGGTVFASDEGGAGRWLRFGRVITETSAAPDLSFMPAGTFGGTWRASSTIESTDTATPFTGNRSTFAATRVVTGTGSNNPNADHAIFAIAAKDDLAGAALGEVGAFRGLSFQNAWGDSSTALFGAYKKIGDGSADEGAITAIEVTARRFTSDLSTLDHWMNCIIGFSPNPTSTWGGRDMIGFYSENHLGAGFANFLGITDGAEAGSGTMEYLIAGFRSREIASRYFSVAAETGDIESISSDAGAGAGPTWVRNRASTSPAANDLLGQDYWRGKNTAAENVDYVRAYGVIVDPTDATEGGAWYLRTMVNGTETIQFRVQNGVTIGSVAPLGTNTLNVQAAIAVGSTVVVDASRGIRHRSYTAAQLGDASNAVNTTDKVAGKTVWDSTNNRLLSAGGSGGTTAWYLSDGTVAITPA
jgi:hypothetical protein